MDESLLLLATHNEIRGIPRGHARLLLSRSKGLWDRECTPAWKATRRPCRCRCKRPSKDLRQRLDTSAVGHLLYNFVGGRWRRDYVDEGDSWVAEEDDTTVVRHSQRRKRAHPVDPPSFSASAPQGPARPASPLPPGVPTGPRNQNRYKDRDGNAPAVEGLDYGGTAKDSTRTPSREPEDRGHSRCVLRRVDS